MTDKKTPTPQRSSKGLFKGGFERLWTALRKSPSRSTSPERSTLGQENPGEEMHLVSHAIVVSGAQLVDHGNEVSGVTSRQGISRISFPRQTAHSRMQMIAPQPRY